MTALRHVCGLALLEYSMEEVEPVDPERMKEVLRILAAQDSRLFTRLAAEVISELAN